MAPPGASGCAETRGGRRKPGGLMGSDQYFRNDDLTPFDRSIRHSTVTDLARFRGLSTSVPRITAV
jgi:hypothetical protein